MADFKSLVYKGMPPNHCCCDSTWRRLPNGEQAVFFLTGGNGEPEIGNFVAMCRGEDEGYTWGPLEPIIDNPGAAATLSEVVVYQGVVTIYVQLHDAAWNNWEVVIISSHDSGLTWSQPVPFEGMPHRAMIRNLYQTSWGDWLLPVQFYEPVDGDWRISPQVDGSFANPWNGNLIGPSPNGPWRRTQCLQGARNWAEHNVVELRDGRLVMLVRSDGTGHLLRSESADRGETWSPWQPSGIPNPGSKPRLFRLRDGRILLLHNPNPMTKHPNSKPVALVNRNPLSLWISDDDMETWGYKRDITDFPGMVAYPDGEVDEDERFLHFAFDYNRHDVIYWRVEIPSAAIP